MDGETPTGSSIEAIERLYAARLGRFRRVAHAILADREAARDAVQDAFAAAVRKRRTFRGDGDLEGWLWRMVVNAALGEHRRRRRRPVAAWIAGSEVPGGNGQGELAGRVGMAVALLPERQRLAIFLHYYADLDYTQIGEVLEVSPGTVAASMHAARKTLRQTLEREEARQ